MLVYAHSHDASHTDEPPLAEGHAPLVTTEGLPVNPVQLTTALRSITATLPCPIDTLTLVIPAAQCRLAKRSFPAGLKEPEAHALAAQMATQIAAELGHTAAIAFDWRYLTTTLATNEIALCLAPRTLIAGYMDAVQAAGLRCIAITPETLPTDVPQETAPFNLIPWRNLDWLKQGRTRILWLVATTLLILAPAARMTSHLAAQEQALIVQQARLTEVIKTRQAQLPDLAKLRQQLAAQQAAQQAELALRETTLRQQNAWATRLDQLARRRPQGVRYHSLDYDNQGMRLEGLAQTPAALTHLLKALPCLQLSEGHRDAQGAVRFGIKLPITCAIAASTKAP